MTELYWDVFICHASEDKPEIVELLVALLTERGIKAWFDRAEIKVAESLRGKIDEGLSASRFGVIILSPRFFAKAWTKAELGALVSRHLTQSKTILPA